MCHICGFICYLCVELKFIISTRSFSNQALNSAHPSLLSSRCWPWGLFIGAGQPLQHGEVRDSYLAWVRPVALCKLTKFPGNPRLCMLTAPLHGTFFSIGSSQWYASWLTIGQGTGMCYWIIAVNKVGTSLFINYELRRIQPQIPRDYWLYKFKMILWKYLSIYSQCSLLEVRRKLY